MMILAISRLPLGKSYLHIPTPRNSMVHQVSDSALSYIRRVRGILEEPSSSEGVAQGPIHN